MNWAVVVFPGSNCDDDAVGAIRQIDGDHVDKVWHQNDQLGDYDVIVLPGGFSYGDYLRSGAIAKFSPVMRAVIDAAQSGKFVLGICNGFQVLTEAGLLPGGLLRNDHLQFRCEPVRLRVNNATSPFTCDFALHECITVPIAHGEGRYYADPAVVAELTATGRIAFTYENNPNGSVADIAGILNERGNVLGMMPHPERAVAPWMQSEDGVRLFTSIRRYAKEAVHVG